MCFPASALCNRGKALRHQKRNPFYRAPHVSIYIYYIYKHISTHIISNHIHIFSTYLKIFPIYIYISRCCPRISSIFQLSLHLLSSPPACARINAPCTAHGDGLRSFSREGFCSICAAGRSRTLEQRCSVGSRRYEGMDLWTARASKHHEIYIVSSWCGKWMVIGTTSVFGWKACCVGFRFQLPRIVLFWGTESHNLAQANRTSASVGQLLISNFEALFFRVHLTYK